jgi:proteasome lid subunit RPN8/RPN11
MVYPLDNTQASATAYTIDPVGHFGALRHAERNGLELIGAFHSHPTGSAEPSATDVRLAAEPDWRWVIFASAGTGRPESSWIARAWMIRHGAYQEVDLSVAPGLRHPDART